MHAGLIGFIPDCQAFDSSGVLPLTQNGQILVTEKRRGERREIF